MAAFKIVRVSHEEDVFAADETKVHTLSRQAISELLDTAAREEAISSAPPPPESGPRVQNTGTERPARMKSGMVPAIPRAAALPIMWDDDEEGVEPTRLSERASHHREQLVTQLINDPPVIICREEPVAAGPEVLPTIIIPEEVRPAAAAVPSTGIDRRAVAITLATFLATVVPALVLLHHLLAR